MYKECDYSGLFNSLSRNLILAITATDIETAALHDAMSPIDGGDQLLKTYQGANTYYCGKLGCYPIVHVQTGRIGSSQQDAVIPVVIESIRDWEVKAVVMPGIAFGRDPKKQKIGDVMISQSISLYEIARVSKEETINRGNISNPSSILYNRFSNIINEVDDYDAYKCHLLSGEKLVDNITFKNRLFEMFPAAKGGEMEGAGLSSACDRLKVDWILVKAICDWGDGKKNKKHQAIASRNSVDFCKRALSQVGAFNVLGVDAVDSIKINSVICTVPVLQESISPKKISYDKLMSSRIVSLTHKDGDIKTFKNKSDVSKKIHYEYILASVFGEKQCGYLFLGRDIIINSTIEDFISKCNFPDVGLYIFSPRVYSNKLKRDDFRITNIENAVVQNDTLSQIDIEYYFIDNYIWQKCINKENDDWLMNNISRIRFYEDQYLFDTNQKKIGKDVLSIPYFTEIIKKNNHGEEHRPITVILGDGGTGKSTLTEELVRNINKIDNRRALYISSTDLQDINIDVEIRSIKDLYNVYCREVNKITKGQLDYLSLELNLSCGNIALIIDGLDEIESILKGKFSLPSFLDSIIAVNNSYRNCKVIVTSRKYHLSKYLNEDEVDVVCLNGFDRNAALRYVQNRLNSRKATIALSYMNIISPSENYNPLFLSLICDILDNDEDIDLPQQLQCKYLVSGLAIDGLVEQVLKRELGKQSIDYSLDQVFEIVIEICVGNNGAITKKSFDEFTSYVFDILNPDKSNVPLYVNPLFKGFDDVDYIYSKYDFLVPFVKARYIYKCLSENMFKDRYLLQTMSEFYDGTGSVFHELCTIYYAPLVESNKDNIKKLINFLKSKFDTVGDDKHAHEIVKKTISASLYLLFKTNPCRDKIERTKLLQNVFNSDITHLCIYGDFYPLDFTLLNINESYFYDYGGLSRSSFPTKNTVFFYSHIDCKERAGKYKIAPKVFDESCKLTLDVQLATKFYSLTKNDAVDMVEDDLKYILKPYYSSSHFVSNPVDDFRRKPFLKCRISYEIFFNILIAHGVIVSNSKYSQISDGFQDSVKHLISNHVTDRKLKKVVEIISDCVLEG